MGLREWAVKRLGGKVALKEESYPSNVIDPDDQLYRQLGGTSERELSPYVHDRALRLAWHMHEGNPVAHGIIEIMKDHIVGEGITLQSEDPEVVAVLQKHWKDPVNNWELKQHDRVRELSLFGEQCYIAFVNEADGQVKLASVDPLNIKEVWCNKDNPEDTVAIVVNDRSAGSNWNSNKVYRVIHLDEDPESETFGHLIGMTEGETYKYPHGEKDHTYDGSCFWFTVNKISHAKRGRSDILSSLDWLDLNDQVHMNFADRMLLMNMFIWDVTLQGANDSQIQEWMGKYGSTPKPATVRVHNENEAWKPEAPDLKAAEFETHQKAMKAQILSSTNLPPHWFGEQDANRATAVEMGSPTLKRLTSRQVFVRFMIHHILCFQLDQAAIAGVLAKPEEGEWEFEVVMPEISVRDLQQASTGLFQATNALSVAWNAGFIDVVEAQNLFAIVASQLGADINVPEMRKRLEENPPPPPEGEEEEGPVVEAAMSIVRRVSGNGHL